MGCRCCRAVNRRNSLTAERPAPASAGNEESAVSASQVKAAEEQTFEDVSNTVSPNELELIEKDEDAAVGEWEELEARRDKEKSYVLSRDTTEFENAYLVSTSWLTAWKEFVCNSGPVPGPIDNDHLMDASTGAPKLDIQVCIDYRGVNYLLWHYWHERYGGGPVVRVPSRVDSSESDANLPSGEEASSEMRMRSSSRSVEAPQPKAATTHFGKRELGCSKRALVSQSSISSPAPAKVMAPRGITALFDQETALSQSNEGTNHVNLNVYDLGRDVDLVQWINRLSTLNDSVLVGGLFHAGVEVYATEWSYGRTEGGTGVHVQVPRSCEHHTYHSTVPLGATTLSRSEVVLLLSRMMELWPGNQYDLLQRNCLTFCNELCLALGVRRIPDWVDRAPRTASVLRNTALSASSLLSCTSREK